MSHADLKRLLAIIEQQLDWGEAATWQSKDFEILNELILEKTKVSLSSSTLRRLWGKVEYNHLPSGTTLDTLARFAGFDNWRAFTRQNTAAKLPEKSVAEPVVAPKKAPGRWLVAGLLLIAVAAISLVSMYAKKAGKTAAPGTFSFSSRPVTRGIPNSVIFDYDARISSSDSLSIQQSWDPTTRSGLDRERHRFTSVYYRPGFYHAKLLVNNKVVKEHLLMIPTNGWLGLIAHQPIPVYLSDQEFIHSNMLEAGVPIISQKNIPLEPQPPMVEYYNVGNFEPVSLKDFSFTTMVKNDFHDGAATCQYMNILLFTDNTPVIVPLSAIGCVSDLRLLDGRYFLSGKTNDLSGFGADLSQWVKLTCRSVPGKIQYLVNDKLVFESELPIYNENIIGIGYQFQGTGSVKQVALAKGSKTVFRAF